MSGSAADEISEMLQKSIAEIEQIVKATQSSVEEMLRNSRAEVQNGTHVAKECGEILEQVVGSAQNVSALLGSIAQASKEQARGISEVNQAVSDFLTFVAQAK